VYQPNTKFKEKRNATSQHSAKMKKEKEMSAPSPHLKESFLLLRSKEWAKGEKERRKKRQGKIWSSLLALGTSSSNAFILSAILSLRRNRPTSHL